MTWTWVWGHGHGGMGMGMGMSMSKNAHMLMRLYSARWTVCCGDVYVMAQ